MNRKLLNLFLFFSSSLLCCKKETVAVDTKSFIIGKWDGISRLSTLTSVTSATGQRTLWYDSLVCNDSSYFSVEFKADSVITLSLHMHPSLRTYSSYSPSYLINSNMVAYFGNPFINYPEALGLDGFLQVRSSNILFLTSDSLILYALDTLSHSPLKIKESWYRFRRKNR